MPRLRQKGIDWRRLELRLMPDLHSRFVDKAGSAGVSMNEIVSALVTLYVDGRVSVEVSRAYAVVYPPEKKR